MQQGASPHSPQTPTIAPYQAALRPAKWQERTPEKAKQLEPLSGMVAFPLAYYSPQQPQQSVPTLLPDTHQHVHHAFQ